MVLLNSPRGSGRALAIVAVLAASPMLCRVGAQAATEAVPEPSESANAASPSRRLAEAERAVSHARTLLGTLTQRLEGATSRSDIVMVDCLTPLRTQLEATLASAETRLRALRLLSNGGDEAAIEHEHTMVMVAGQRAQVVESDMNQCLGDADITTGDNRVTVEVTVDLPDEDVTAPLSPPPTPPVPYVPPPLSPAS